MAKFFSILKNQTAILGTMMVLIFLGSGYFFFYIPQNEKTVQERHFRCLQSIDFNVHKKIDASTLQISSLLQTCIQTPTNSKPVTADSLNHYINHYSKENFTLLPIQITAVTRDDDELTTIASDADLKQFTLSVTKKIKSNPLCFTKYTNVAGNSPKANITADSVNIEMAITYKIKNFIIPLLTPGVFDHYVVFYNSKGNEKAAENKVVYESFPSGLSYRTKDSLLQTRNGVITPGIRSLNLSGPNYKVFTQAINIDATSEFVVAGLVSEKNYDKEKNQLPSGVVLLLLTAAIIMVVSLPWIKLYHMGSKDKLTVADGIASVLVAMLLMSLVFFVVVKYCFSYNIHFNSNYSRFSSSSDTLAAKMTHACEAELANAYSVLTKYDSIHSKFKENIIRLDTKNASYKTIDNPPIYTLLSDKEDLDSTDITLSNKSALNVAITQVYWLDKSGKEVTNWNTENYNSPHIQFNIRDYFKNIINDRPNKPGRPEFDIDQVFSLTRNVFTSVIAKKSADPSVAVAAMTFTLKCFDSVIMPNGYQFAIVDDNGKVRYHSHPERNLNENLKREFADSSELVSSLEARSDTTFQAEYYGKQYNIKIKPFVNLPYSIVIFENREYIDARDTEPYVFTLSMHICLMVYVIIQFCVVFLISSSRSFFKKHIFDTSWIAPNSKSYHQYNVAIMGNGLIISLLIIFFTFCSFLSYIFILLFSATFIAIFLNYLFYRSYKASNNDKCRLKLNVIKCLSILILIIDCAAFKTLQFLNFGIVILFEAILVRLSILLYNNSEYLLQKVRKYKQGYAASWTHVHGFALMATTRLIITSGIPVAFFYIYSFNYEQNLETRYRQLTFARALAQKVAPAKLVGLGKDSNKIPAMYTDNVFIAAIKTDSVPQIHTGEKRPDSLFYSKEDFYAVNILSAFRLLISNTELKSNDMNVPPANGDAFYNNITNYKKPGDFTSRTYFKIDSAKNTRYLKITSANVNYPFWSMLLWQLLPLLALLVGFYFVVLSVIRKLFALSLLSTDEWKVMDAQILADNELNRLIFILGSPGSGKLTRLKEKLTANKLTAAQKIELAQYKTKADRRKKLIEFGKMLGAGDTLLAYKKTPAKSNVYIIDMIQISAEKGADDPEWIATRTAALSGYELVIINHFEYNIKDYRANLIKLDFLETLMQKETSKVIIISTVHPLTFLDSFNEKQCNPLPDPNQKDQNLQNCCMPESELERWQVLLGHFRIIIDKLQTELPTNYDTSTALQKTIMQETRYAHYLNYMQPMTLATEKLMEDKDDGQITDSLIFKLQITSHYFYTYIWQSLTKEEKFLLYDLAEDGLVNPFDDYNLSMLLSKGLIIKSDGRLMLFNKGFRNFILTAIGTTELNRIKEQVKDNGNWGSLKTPMNIVIIAILAFLIVSQQETYAHLITYVTALGASIPVVLRVFSFVGSAGKTPKSS